jgi:hypothetical protein
MECTDDCSRVSLTVSKVTVPSVDPGRFNLTIDGVVHKAGAGNGSSTPEVTLAPGAHSVGESAAAGTSLGDYTATFGGDCSPTGQVSLQVGERKTCEITNTRKPGPAADAFLTVTKVLIPATDPGRFNLRIDGVARATNVGNGGSTGSVVVLQGTHVVDEVGNGTNLSPYIRTFSGDCNASGSVALAAGDHKTCTITNRKNTAPCLAACSVAEGVCMSQAHNGSDRQECIRERIECGQQCH